MGFTVVVRRDLSLAELRRLHERGEHVLKTPHVGNHYPNNLAVAALGIPLVCVDRTIGARDRNFHPHRLIHAGRAEDIADPHRVVTHVRVDRAHSHFADRFPVGGSVLAGHMRALRDAFPATKIQTEAESLMGQGDRIFDFLEAATRARPTAWTRFVEADGTVVERRPTPRPWQEIRREGIHSIALQNGAGWIIPNEWCILWDSVVAALDGKPDVYELSGPDMIRYIGRLAPDIDRTYGAMREALPSWTLPEQVTFHIVPVAAMRFAVASDRRPALEHLITTYRRMGELREEWSARIQARTGEARRAEITRIAEERPRETERLREAVHAVPEIFYEIERADFLSQYDLLTGTTLAVHPWGLETSITAIEEAMRWFTHLRSGATA